MRYVHIVHVTLRSVCPYSISRSHHPVLEHVCHKVIPAVQPSVRTATSQHIDCDHIRLFSNTMCRTNRQYLSSPVCVAPNRPQMPDPSDSIATGHAGRHTLLRFCLAAYKPPVFNFHQSAAPQTATAAKASCTSVSYLTCTHGGLCDKLNEANDPSVAKQLEMSDVSDSAAERVSSKYTRLNTGGTDLARRIKLAPTCGLILDGPSYVLVSPSQMTSCS